VGIPAFLLVIFASPVQSAMMFGLGTLLIGFGAGLFGHGTLTATMNLAPAGQAGLALGAWGAVQATAAGIAVALGGIIRDVVAMFSNSASGYMSVYSIEIILMLATIIIMLPLIKKSSATSALNLDTQTPQVSARW
jgi:BCD family chlorophyll transporter-like MFS transporter